MQTMWHSVMGPCWCLLCHHPSACTGVILLSFHKPRPLWKLSMKLSMKLSKKVSKESLNKSNSMQTIWQSSTGSRNIRVQGLDSFRV